MSTEPSRVRVAIRNLRVIERLEVTFDRGVSLVVGPTGAGKSTLLHALTFFSELADGELHGVLESLGGAAALQRLDSSDDEPVVLELAHDAIEWSIEIRARGGGVDRFHGETLRVGGEDAYSTKPGAPSVELPNGAVNRGDPSVMKMLRGTELAAPWIAFAEWADRIRVYQEPWLDRLRRGSDPRRAHHGFLHRSSANLWTVLANWRGGPRRWGGRFEWVTEQAKAAFPDVFEALEFTPEGAAEFFLPNTRGEDGLSVAHAPNGLLLGLAHLTAVAGAERGGLVAIDEIENGLHPFAIVKLLEAFRARAEEHDLTIVLTSHSPVVMDEFHGHEDQFFYFDPKNTESVLRRLTDFRDEDWLRAFRLGSLYARGEFGAPVGIEPTVE